MEDLERGYKKIDYTRFFGEVDKQDSNFVQMTQFEINAVNKIILPSRTGRDVYYYEENRKSSYLIAGDVAIYKNFDDWFFVNIMSASGGRNAISPVKENNFYECDQLEGLINLLKDKYRSEEVNEKIKWSNLLFALGLAYIGISKYGEYNKIKDIYQVVNSNEATPTSNEAIWIEKIRSEVIDQIKVSNLFKKFDKEYIIDSIQNINFRIVDDQIPFSKGARACYIYIKPLKGKYTYLLQDQIPSGENFIIINRKSMKDSNYAEVVVHEIYHYFDRLLTGGEERYSEENKIAQFIDTNLDDERYTKKKIMALMLFANNKGKSENEVVDALYDEYMDNKKYFVSEPELFARYKTLKHQMVKGGYISSINESVTIEKLAEYLFGLDAWNRSEQLFILLSLDLKKLKDLDKLL